MEEFVFYSGVSYQIIIRQYKVTALSNCQFRQDSIVFSLEEIIVELQEAETEVAAAGNSMQCL